MSTINYTARLHSTTADGILAHTSELYDTEKTKFQSAINKEVGEKLIELEKNIGSKISGVYRPKGSKPFDQVMALTPAIGDVYDIPAEFTLNGKKYPAHTNIVAIVAAQGESSWDALGGTVDVQDILSKAAAAADEKLKPVSAAAEAAKNTATAANATAGQASATATDAQGKAVEAKTAADNAERTAGEANTAAQAASAAADTAKADATVAKNTANDAKADVRALGSKQDVLTKIITAYFTEFLFVSPSDVKQESLITWPTEIAYDSQKNAFICKDSKGDYYNNWAGSDPWKIKDQALDTNTENKVYWYFKEDNTLTPYIYFKEDNRLVPVGTQTERSLSEKVKSLENKVTALENLLKLV